LLKFFNVVLLPVPQTRNKLVYIPMPWMTAVSVIIGLLCDMSVC